LQVYQAATYSPDKQGTTYKTPEDFIPEERQSPKKQHITAEISGENRTSATQHGFSKLTADSNSC
jgi:hypothetical protein